ncbi:MAG: S8 family serine peptidase, partial [Bacteroidota bacterium]
SILILISIAMSFSLLGQTSNYHSNRILVSFKSDVSDASIAQYQNAFKANEVAYYPASNVYVWEFSSFPIQYSLGNQSKMLLNINNVNQHAGEIPEVESVGYDYLFESQEETANANDAQGTSYTCAGEYNIIAANGIYNTKLSIMDSGFSPSNAQNDNYFFNIENYTGWNYVNDHSNITDDNDHGSHITSIVNHVSHSFNHVAPERSYTQYDIRKAFNENGQAYLSDVVGAINDCIQYGVNIINFSFSYKAADQANRKSPMQLVIDAAERNNILIITAAGNDYGIDNDVDQIKTYPASFNNSNILSVASVSCNGQLSSFSNFGRESIDIAAPGEGIEGLSADGNLIYLSGTSQATAIVSGVANIIASHMETFSYNELKCAILRGARFEPNLIGKVKTNGVIDIDNALNYLGNCNIDITENSNARNASEEKSEITNQSSFIYPNPVSDVMNISLAGQESHNANLIIFDLNGRMMHQQQINITQGKNLISLNMPSQLQNGCYVVSVKSSEVDLKQMMSLQR